MTCRYAIPTLLLAGLLCVLAGCSYVNGFNATFGQAFLEMASPEAAVYLYDVQIRTDRHRYAMVMPMRAAEGPLPCIVFLHGRGECGTDGYKPCIVGLVSAAMMSASAVERVEANTGPDGVTATAVRTPAAWDQFVIIAPQKPDTDAPWAEYEELVLACLEHARGHIAMLRGFTLDSARTYLTGLSQGGAGTWAIGSRHPELFAAIAPVCGFVHDPKGRVSGAAPVGDDAQRAEIAARLATAKMPVWAFHGEKDDIVLPEQTRLMVAAIEAAGGEARATYFPSANHNAWDPTYRDNGAELAQWLLSQRRPEAPQR